MKYKIFIPLMALLSLPLIFESTPTQILKLRIFDTFQKQYDPSGNFVILNITEEDVEREGGWPFPRDRLAQIHIDLLNEGAIGVGWVIAFPQADRFGGDEAFAEALGYSPSVIAMFEDGSGYYPKTTGTVIKGPDIGGIMSSGVKANQAVLISNSIQGLAIAPTEVDNLVRRIPLLVRTPDGWIPSFGTQIYKSLFDVKTYIINTTDNGISEISIRGIPPVKTDPLGRKWISWVDTPQTDLKEMAVAGKFVFIGVTASGVFPQIATPNGLLEPHKIQTALAESLLIQDSPYIPDWSLAVEVIIFIVSVLLICVLTSSFGISGGLILGVSTMLLTASSGFYMIQRGLLIDVSWSLVSQFVMGSVAFYMRFREQYRLRQQIKKQFEHYLDPRQIKRLQDDPSLLRLGGEKRRCTYLFSDLRNFTSLSEAVGPEKVTYIMNRVLTAQQNAVQKHGGMVDKYIGDAMMAVFNAPIDLDHHEQVAVDCALDILEEVNLVAKDLEDEGLPKIAIGLGLNTGYSICGNMGSQNRFDYTCIGSAVNEAARLESSTKERKVDILIGEETEKYCGHHLKELDPIKVKGVSEPLKIFTIKD